MNNGKTIMELAQELRRRDQEKSDYLVETTQLTMEPEQNRLVLEGQDQAYPVTDLAHRQLATWADIPYKYYEKMQDNSAALLAGNVNHWLHNPKKPTRRMVRTLDGDARAFLSNRYRRIDNLEVAEAALPILAELDDLRVISSDVTDTHLYIKALFPRLEGEVQAGDLVQAGVVISNSEVGCGALKVSPLIYRLVCTNGMVADASGDYSLNKYHVGRNVAADSTNYEIFRDETMQADDRAVLLKLQDTVRAAFSQDIFNILLGKMRESTGGPKIQIPTKAVETLGKTCGLNESEKGSVLENLIKGQDYSRWGALNAVTEVANTNSSYERSTELESIGGRLLDLPPSAWKRIAEAA
ncbi:MAG: DUF945 domain-containing protein [Gammaproteobacteria bacterium]|nr:DUF945 domain-containing protein [Gammaproteobacteria bacterium]